MRHELCVKFMTKNSVFKFKLSSVVFNLLDGIFGFLDWDQIDMYTFILSILLSSITQRSGMEY